MSKVDVLLGLQWGDEGKGKIVDVLSKQYDVVARFQGGPNAGHTLEFDNQKFILNTIPSGVFNENSINLIGNGVVIDPITLRREIETLAAAGHDVRKNGKLLIARKAHVILPTHQLLDAANERKAGTGKIGSTLKGIGPTYMDKTGRNGLRMGDIESEHFKEKYAKLKAKHEEMLAHFDFTYDLAKAEQKFFESVEFLKSIPLVDGEHFINEQLGKGARILAEGAQGTLLDVDFGSYPFVTSSNTTTAGACTGLGIAPNKIGEVIGIFKAYCTRVGSGPFPTELDNETGELLRSKGFEFGAVSGRKRRCGWLDLPALKYAIMLNGVTELVITKADVLCGFDEILVCTAYSRNNETFGYMPFDIVENMPQPVYKKMPGWSEEIQHLTVFNEVPAALKNYLSFLEAELGVAIKYLSVGPDRAETITM